MDPLGYKVIVACRFDCERKRLLVPVPLETRVREVVDIARHFTCPPTFLFKLEFNGWDLNLHFVSIRLNSNLNLVLGLEFHLSRILGGPRIYVSVSY